MQSPGSRYLAMQVNLLRRATTSVNERICSSASRYTAKKGGLHKQKARIHIQIRSVGLNFVY